MKQNKHENRQKVADRVLEDIHVRAGYILGILFVLLIKKYYVLSYFILFYFIANLSFNFKYNLVIAEISFTLQFSNDPPTQPPTTHRKSSDICDISAVTDQILMKI